MPRGLSPQMTAAIAQQALRPAIFVQCSFKSGTTIETVNIWSGYGPITWNGLVFTGVGTLGTVSLIEEASTVEAKGITLTLSGLDPSLLQQVLREYRLGLPVTVWFGLFDATGALIPSPVVSFAGRMDQPTLTLDGNSATITIACESKLLELNTPAERRYTHQDQQVDYPGDLGFIFVPSIQTVQIFFGRSPSSSNIFGSEGTGGWLS